MSGRGILPFADAPRLRRARRRATLLSAATSLGLAGALVYCASAALLHSGAADAARRDRPTVVVLDVSGSVSTAASRRIRRLLTSVAADGSGGVGLVLFSDTGYVALPPRSSAREVRAYGRYFGPAAPAAKPSSSPAIEPGGSSVSTSPTPWGVAFTDGTAVSSGLAAAREALSRAGIDTANIVVASDFFDDMSDSSALRRELGRLTRMPGISLETEPLPPSSTTGLAMFRQFAKGKVSAYRRHATPKTTRRGGTAAGAGTMSPWLLAAACLGLLAVAADWLLNARLSWGEVE